MTRHITIDIPAPYFPPVRDRKTGKIDTSNDPKNPGITRNLWDNRSGPGGACNTTRGLTRSSGTSREGLT